MKTQDKIDELQKQIDALREECSGEFEFKYTARKTFKIDESFTVCEQRGSSPSYLTHGKYRITKENAELALERNRLANRLEAAGEQIESDWKPDWSDKSQAKWIVYYNHFADKYICSWDGVCEHIGIPHFSETTAKKLVELLNSGKLVL